jgi:hypothetical protein
MKPILLTVAAATLCMADTWTGKLVDAACKVSNQASDPKANCEPTQATNLFAIELAGAYVLNLDALGNEIAASAVKNVAKASQATVTGSRTGQFIKVESLEVH